MSSSAATLLKAIPLVFASVYSTGSNPDYIHTQLAHGCTGDPGKAADGFAKATLVAAPEIVEPEEPAETTAASRAAQTADFGIIVSAVLFAASAAGVVGCYPQKALI